MRKPALSEREIETLKQLREQLPEYEIYPNMRLADVIKADWKLFRSIGTYHLDFVVCDYKAHVIAAIELDDSTHDNPKARERDAKKDGYLREAGIRLFRIRAPHEANQIAKLIKFGGSERTAFNPREGAPFARSCIKQPSIFSESTKISLAIMAVSAIGLWVFWLLLFNNASQNFKKQIADRVAVAKQAENEQQKILIQRGQEISNQLPSQNVLAQPVYQQVLVKGKSVRECRGAGNVIDNKSVQCMNDHYEMVEVGKTQEQRTLIAKVEQDKAAAWDKFYKEPRSCINPALGEETRECMRIAIAAKNSFETEWKVKHGG